MVQLLNIVSCDRVPVFWINLCFVMHAASFPFFLSELTQKTQFNYSLSNKTVCVAYILKERAISIKNLVCGSIFVIS